MANGYMCLHMVTCSPVAATLWAKVASRLGYLGYVNKHTQLSDYIGIGTYITGPTFNKGSYIDLYMYIYICLSIPKDHVYR